MTKLHDDLEAALDELRQVLFNNYGLSVSSEAKDQLHICVHDLVLVCDEIVNRKLLRGYARERNDK